MTKPRNLQTRTLSLLGLATLTLAPVLTLEPALAQSPNAAPAQDQPQAAQPYNRAAVEATDGRYVPPDGSIDGSSVKQFLNSGALASPSAMEEASIPADNWAQMPASVINTKGGGTYSEVQGRQAAQQLADGKQPHKKQKKQKPHGFFYAMGQPFRSTLNFMGFPVSLNEDVGIDASLSSDLPEAVRQRDGAYNPNVSPAEQATTNKFFGQ